MFFDTAVNEFHIFDAGFLRCAEVIRANQNGTCPTLQCKLSEYDQQYSTLYRNCGISADKRVADADGLG